jgi:hypothetical protein
MAEDKPTADESPAPPPVSSQTPPAAQLTRRRRATGSAALTRRAVAVGLILVAFIAAFTPYNDYILGNSPFIGNHFPISVVTIMVLLAAIWNPALRAAARFPTLPDAIVGLGAALVSLFVLHASETVLAALRWVSHAGLPAAGPLADRLLQHPGELFLFNLALTAIIVALLYGFAVPRRWMHRLRIPFEPGELAVIMTLTLIGAAIPSSGLMRYLEPTIVTPFWHQKQQGWFSEVTALFPQWLVPSSNPDSPIVMSYWLGIDPVRNEHVPVIPFLLPLLLWGILFAALMGGAMFLAAIFRKQWIVHERLSYPLATIPLELMAAPEEGKRYNILWRNPILWVGVVIPVFVYLLAGLHSRFPGVPQIDLHFALRDSFREQPWNALPNDIVDARLYFAAVGICFFIPSEVALSLWLFVVANGLLRVIFSRTSFVPGLHENTRAMGIYAAYFAGLLWLARGHLRVVAAAAWRKAPRAEDEPLSYRAMLGGLLICMGIAWLWLMLAGMNWLMAMVLLAIGTMLLTLMSRIVVETGLFWVGPTFWPKEIFISLLGKGLLSTRSFFWTQVLSTVFYGDLRENIMPYAANSLRMTHDMKDSPEGGRRHWFLWLGAALLLSFLISGGTHHYLSYTHGRASMNDNWSSAAVPHEMLNETYTFDHLKPETSFAASWGHFIAGAAMAVVLMVGRALWAAWPLHPIGLVLMDSGPMHALWFSIFIGWGIKALLLRYGGAGAFRRARPFFIGLIVGEIVAAGMWMFVGLGTHGAVTFRFLPG